MNDPALISWEDAMNSPSVDDYTPRLIALEAQLKAGNERLKHMIEAARAQRIRCEQFTWWSATARRQTEAA